MVSDESKDAIINKMSGLGCIGVMEGNEEILAYFPFEIEFQKIIEELNLFADVLKNAGLDHSFSFEYSMLPEKDWNEAWKKSFSPINVGERLTILPPWENEVKGRINLIIDPGMAFGTGHHETTKRCLTLIEKFSEDTAIKRFLDAGTGTGVLAIAASKLGYREAVGIDSDPIAVDAAIRNVRLNDLDNVVIKSGGISDAEGMFDMIVANIVSETIINFSNELISHLCAGGIIILSGMLTGQEKDVIKAMDAEGLRLIGKFSDNEWISLVYSRHEPNL